MEDSHYEAVLKQYIQADRETLKNLEVGSIAEVKCRMVGDIKHSFLQHRENFTCSDCGCEYVYEAGPRDHRDPEWDYRHPETTIRVRKVQRIAFERIS